MKKSVHATIGTILGLCIFTASLSGCATQGRNMNQQNQQQAQQGTQNQPGTNPLGMNAQPTPQRIMDTNPGTGIANPNAGMSGKNPNTGMYGGTNQNTGMNGGRNQNAGQNQQQNQQALPQQINYNTQRSDNIRKQLVTMREVDGANVVVMGNSCLVAYKPGRVDLDTNATKNAIINKVKQLDKNITNVTVSESQGMMNDLGRLSNDIANNKPMHQLNNEFTRIMQNMNPVTR